MAFALRTGTAEVRVRQAPVGRLGEGAWGVSGMVRRYAATGEEQLTAPANARTVGAFTYQELPLGRRGAAFQAGARVDRYAVASRDDPASGPGVERRFTAVSGSAGFTAPLAEGVTAALSGARSFRAPTVEELFSDGVHVGTASYERGDPRLAPEVARGVDAVLRVRRPALTAELSGYATAIDGFVHFAERGDTVVHGTVWPVLAYVQDRAAFRGIEAQAEVALRGRWVLGARGDVVRGRLADGAVVPYLPAARTAATVRWDDGRFSAGGGVRHAFSSTGAGPADEPPTAAYTLLDLEAGVRLLRGDRMHAVQLRAENVGDVLYRDAASRIKDFAPNPGRNVSLLYRLSF